MDWNNKNAGRSSGLNPVEEDVAGFIRLQREEELTGQSGSHVGLISKLKFGLRRRGWQRENSQATKEAGGINPRQ